MENIDKIKCVLIDFEQNEKTPENQQPKMGFNKK